MPLVGGQVRRCAALAACALLALQLLPGSVALYEPSDGLLLIDSVDAYNDKLVTAPGPALVGSAAGLPHGWRTAWCRRAAMPRRPASQACVRCAPSQPARTGTRPAAAQVEFFVPTCAHCVALAPEMQKVARNLEVSAGQRTLYQDTAANLTYRVVSRCRGSCGLAGAGGCCGASCGCLRCTHMCSANILATRAPRSSAQPAPCTQGIATIAAVDCSASSAR